MKKIIVSILSIFIIFNCINCVKAYTLNPGSVISYVTANSSSDAEKKYDVYGTVRKDNRNTNSPWNRYITENNGKYLKRIYRASMSGYDAFCLDPGLGNAGTYREVSSNDSDFTKLLSRIAELNAIYNLDVEGKKIYYGTSSGLRSITINSDDEYCIKQLLFWRLAKLTKTSALYGLINFQASLKHTNGQIVYFYDYYFNGFSNQWGDSLKILLEDICNAVLHNHQRTGTSYTSIDDTAYSSKNKYTISTKKPGLGNGNLYPEDIEVIPYENNLNLFVEISRLLKVNYDRYNRNEFTLTATLFESNNTNQQRFVGIKVEEVKEPEPTPEPEPEPTPAPTGDITYYKQTGASSYTPFDNASLDGYNVGDRVSFSLIKSISNYLVHDISGVYASGIVDDGSTVSFEMPENKLSISVYYNYRIVDYSHLLTNGNKIDAPSGKSNPTKTTTFTAGIISVDSWTNSDGFLYSTQHTVSGYYTKLKYMYGKKIENQTSSVSESSVHTNGTQFSSTSASISGFEFRSRKYYSYINFYYDPVPSVKVVVRHLVRQANGSYAINYSLTNATAVVYNGQRAYSGVGIGSTIVENRYSQRKSVIKNSKSTLDSAEVSSYQNIYFGYSEFYEIDDKDQIIIDRSRVLMQNGKYYKCGGVRTATTGSADLSKINSLPFSSTSSLQQKISGNPGDYIYIDYYYDEVDLTTSVESSIGTTARLKFWPSAAGSYTSLGTNNSVVESNSGNENDNVAYVPASENLKPYVKSDLCRPYTMKYGLTLSGYTVEDYKVWGISDSSNMGKVNDIIGAENQVYSVDTYMSTNGSLVRSNISKTISDISSVSGVFTSNANSANNSFNSIFNKVSSYKTDQSYYINAAKYNIADNKYNGIREPSGSVDYKIYSVYSGNASGGTRVTQNISTTNSMKVNIYTPATVDETKVGAIDFVNHSNIDNNTNGIIQQGVTFDVTVSTKKDAYPVNIYNQIGDTGKYVKYWYLMFDFDVTYGGRTYTANEPIKVNANRSNKYAETTITGLQAITNSEDKTVIESTLNHVKAIAATINLENDDYAINHLKQTTATKADTNSSDVRIANNYIPFGTTGDLGLSKASYYLVSKVTETISIGRVFDFEITDCLDVNFKDVFRVLNSEDKSVNSLTGTRYFSGIRRLLSTDSITNNSTNILADRAKLVVGSVTKILPLGPYKHTTNAYINSVKLGYRFSFDLKTSGYYNPGKNEDVKRSVKITPSYYYISKDGKTYNDNIKLYYKNSSGNYVDFETSNYTIYYKPDDGYRNLYNSSTYTETDVSKTSSNGTTTLTSSLVALKLGSKNGFTLNSNKSMTISDKGYLQAWYGEFKLPNSTIALAVDKNGRIDINSPMTDGYIGVKFKIECIDSYKNRTEDVIISYDKNDTCLGKNTVNTSQWDYEGYLGFKESNIGSNLNGTLKIQLENGVWNIDDAMYNNVKGTVILYDLDNRAANDYD